MTAAPPRRQNRILLILMIAMMACAAVAVVTLWHVAKDSAAHNGDLSGAIGGPFSLTDEKGEPVTDQTYKGSYRLIYFGYTFCPDACPTELQVMAEAMDDLHDDAARVQPIFITIDPERDTVKQLAGYVPMFYPRLAGLTGTPAEIAQVAKEYKVFYSKADQPSGAYLMNHSSFVYLMDPDGKFLTVFPSDMDSEKMASEIRKAMGKA